MSQRETWNPIVSISGVESCLKYNMKENFIRHIRFLVKPIYRDMLIKKIRTSEVKAKTQRKEHQFNMFETEYIQRWQHELSIITGVPDDVITSTLQKRRGVFCRYIIMVSFWKTFNRTVSACASIYKKDHATFIHAKKALQDIMSYDNAERRMIEEFCRKQSEHGLVDFKNYIESFRK